MIGPENDGDQLDQHMMPYNPYSLLESVEEMKPADEMLQLYVSKPTIVEGIKNYVVYTLSGAMVNEPVLRRFSDFYSLRMKLTERWPGVYIPNTPPKQVVGNTDSRIIDMRLRLLNIFCRKMTKFKAILLSEEMKIFVSRVNDVSKSLDAMKPQGYEEIVAKYKMSFSGYFEAYDVMGGKMKLNSFKDFLQKAFSNLISLKDLVANTSIQRDQEIQQFLSLINVFTEYEKNTLVEYSNNNSEMFVLCNPSSIELNAKLVKLKDDLINPYIQLLEWLQEEEVDIQAMMEALESLTSLQVTYDGLKQKANSLDNDLKTLRAGKTTFKSLFTFKSKEQDILELEHERFTMDGTMTDLGNVIKLASFNMELYIEDFKQEKLNSYLQQLKEFSELQRRTNETLSELLGEVLKDKNLTQKFRYD